MFNVLLGSVPQICSWAVQRPLLANMWPCHPRPPLLSARSLRGAHSDVQLHHEHALSSKGICRDLLDGSFRGTIPRTSHSHQSKRGGSLAPPAPSNTQLEISTQSIRCQESILEAQGTFHKGEQIVFLMTVDCNLWNFILMKCLHILFIVSF